MLKKRYEFIGIQNNETICGHYFATNLTEVTDWLEEQHVIYPIIGFAGLLPEPFVLPHEIVNLLIEDKTNPTNKEVRLMYALNELVLYIRQGISYANSSE